MLCPFHSCQEDIYTCGSGLLNAVNHLCVQQHGLPVSEKRVAESDDISGAKRVQVGSREREHTRKRQRGFVPATSIDCIA